MRKFGLTLFILVTALVFVKAQIKTLDKVVVVVGNSIILQSDIESQYAEQYLAQGNAPNEAVKCIIVQQLLTTKLLAQQAVIDSVTVNDGDVDAEVDRRMRTMTSRAGGQDRLEQFLGRSVIQYKDEIRPEVKEQMVAQKMRQKITEKVNVTPYDVKKFYEAIPKDSLPTYNKEVEVGEISITPVLTADEKAYYKQKAEDLRARVKKGEDFDNLARLYSQDPGSAGEGGDLGFADRSTFVKEFAAMAFKLKAGDVSPVFETDFGFHFLQVIERRGEQVHVKHILIRPSLTPAALERAKLKIDSVYTVFQKNKNIDFSAAAAFYSDDKETKFNGGMILNAENVEARSTFIPTDKLDPQIALIVDTLKIGEISKPAIFTSQAGVQTYKVLYLRSKTDAHKANLNQDFPKIKDLAFEDKINKSLSEWFERRRKDTYVKIDSQYTGCPQVKIWLPTATAQTK